MVFFKHSLMFILIDLFSYTLCKSGECYNNGRFCCDNFEMREGICRKCRLGYASLHKQSCLPCPNNTYGKRCAETCACTVHERCDHVKGCTNTSAALNNTTDIFVEDTTIKPSLKTTENRDHNDSSLKPISIYSISVASLTFMLVVGILLIVYCRRYTGTRSQKSDTKEKHLQQTSQTVEI
ncbi:uncharacterized protein [Mytilus edulis]|uniref:uncharacterized protein n=1 Tax=Mytilus edulis TaxID=6550 RepID=UPI0039EE3ACC